MFRQKQSFAAILIFRIVFYFWLLSSLNRKLAIALSCYENEVNNDGVCTHKLTRIKSRSTFILQVTSSTKISIDSSWSLCVLSFSLSSNSGVKLGNGTLFGIGPESEDLSPVEAVLSVSSSAAEVSIKTALDFSYKILEVCILEVCFFSQYNCKMIAVYQIIFSIMTLAH